MEGWHSDLWLWHSFSFLKIAWSGRLGGAGRLRLEADGRSHHGADSGGSSTSVLEMSRPGARAPAAAAAAAGCYYLRPGTPEGQDLYLRFDQTARRSPYRMSRILARHQLVTKIQQGEWPAADGWGELRFLPHANPALQTMFSLRDFRMPLPRRRRNL